MFYKTLAAAALTIALTSGAAFAQQSGAAGTDGAAGDSVQNPSAGDTSNNTPAATGTVQGGDTVNREYTSDAERTMFESRMDMMGGFFSDEGMTTLRTEDEMGTAFSALTPEEQQALRDDCTNVTGDTSNAYGQSVVDLCTTVGGM